MSDARTDQIIEKYVNKKGILIQLLLEIQHDCGWISKETINKIIDKV
jgi:NADH:ubiquinone oxidoreductase subunit E